LHCAGGRYGVTGATGLDVGGDSLKVMTVGGVMIAENNSMLV
jgi:hypothetical protein